MAKEWKRKVIIGLLIGFTKTIILPGSINKAPQVNKDQQQFVAFYHPLRFDILLIYQGFLNGAGVIQVAVQVKRMLPERKSKVIVLHVLGVV